MRTTHPTPEELLELVQRQGPEARRLEVLDHVMSCAGCRRDFELLRSIETAGAAAEPARPRTWLPLALAASFVLVIGVATVQRAGLFPGDVVRGDGAVTLVAPATAVAANEPVQFAWRAVPGAREYQLEVIGPDDAAIFSETTSDTTLTASALRLEAGTGYRWWVRAATPGGALASPLRPLSVRRE